MIKEAILAMGCFWCGESEFRDHDDPSRLKEGIIALEVGFTGGTKENPTYKDHEGYKEAVKITYDPNKVSYGDLLSIFWKNIDPYDAVGQFCDKGDPYKAVIYFQGEEEQKLAEKTKKETQEKLGGKAIVTEIVPYTNFVKAEDYHQNYKLKNPIRYKYYRWNCGRDQRLAELWDLKK